MEVRQQSGARRRKRAAETHLAVMERVCHHCGRDIGRIERVGRRDACLQCGWDLHCCLNCEFHDPAYHNHCREPQAERQVDKQAGNFCEYFNFRQGAMKKAPPATTARDKLDAMFRKKS